MRILFLMTLVVFFSCKNNNPSAQKPEESKGVSTTENKNVENTTAVQDSVEPADTNVYRLVIMFYSIGNGVETPLINAYEDSIGAYSTEIGKSIDYKRTAWGREGETDIIFRLNELNLAQQQDFIDRTRSILGKGKWVNVYENYPYRKRGR
jgi:hypothetical protein